MLAAIPQQYFGVNEEQIVLFGSSRRRRHKYFTRMRASTQTLQLE